MAVVSVIVANAQDMGKPDAFDCDEAYWVTSIEPEVNAVSLTLAVYRSFGDTIVGGRQWKKMHSCIMSSTDIRTTGFYFDELDFGSECVGLTRKDGDKVYGIVLDPYGFVHEASFECKVGEEILLYDFDETYSYGSDIFCGVERKLFHSPLGTAAEGIGDLYSGPFGPVQMVTTGFNNPNLRLCIVDDEVICNSGGRMIGDYMTRLKYCYDMIMPTSYTVDGGNTWVVGRVEDGRVVSTYQIDQKFDREDGIFALSSGETFSVDKWNTDLATITIDGATRTLYDFGLGVGEVFDNGVVRLTVTDVDTAYFEGYERRVLTMDSGERWIDGIGSTRGLLAPVTEPTDEYEEVLLSCRSGDVVMYVNPIYGSGIDGQLAPTARAYVSDGVLHVTAATAGEHSVSVVAMDGSEVMRTTFAGTSLSQQLPVLPRGVYAIIVADGGEVACRAKVVL